MARPFLATELLVKVGYGNIACKLWGENISTAEKFMAVHGWLDNAGSFDPLMEHFVNKDRCVVCVDLPGHGLSSHFPRGLPYSPPSDLQSMKMVAKHLGWTKYSLIGHSMGAMRSQAYSLCWPDEVKTVICLDGAILPSEALSKGEDSLYQTYGRQADKYLKFITEYHGKNREHTWEELSERWLAAVPDLTKDDFNILMKRGATKLDNGMYVYNRDAALHNRTNALLQYPMETILKAMQKLAHIPQSVFVFSSFGFSDEHVDHLYNLLDQQVKNYPGKMKLVKLPGAHHHHMQHPKETADEMNRFLADVCESAAGSDT